MIRIDAQVKDMTEQDIIDTLPVVENELAEWLKFAEETEILATAKRCILKAEVIAFKKAAMIDRLTFLQLS